MTDADEVIRTLGLRPHPEGGHYRETFRDQTTNAGRASSTAIYYLLKQGETSHWHRVDAVEIWHWYAGDPLELSPHQEGQGIQQLKLGPALRQGHQPQIIVPKHMWQSAKPLGRYTLAGCTVAPGFEFSGFEMAPPNWRPA